MTGYVKYSSFIFVNKVNSKFNYTKQQGVDYIMSWNGNPQL